MKLEIKKLNALKKYTGDFECEYEPPKDICLVPLCGIEGKVFVGGKYEIYDDDSVGVDFTVRYRIVGQCSYCLEDAEKDVEKAFEILFVTGDDEDNYHYDGISIDLKPAVNDAILFSQPNLILCKEDCTGIDVNNK